MFPPRMLMTGLNHRSTGLYKSDSRRSESFHLGWLTVGLAFAGRHSIFWVCHRRRKRRQRIRPPASADPWIFHSAYFPSALICAIRGKNFVTARFKSPITPEFLRDLGASSSGRCIEDRTRAAASRHATPASPIFTSSGHAGMVTASRRHPRHEDPRRFRSPFRAQPI